MRTRFPGVRCLLLPLAVAGIAPTVASAAGPTTGPGGSPDALRERQLREKMRDFHPDAGFQRLHEQFLARGKTGPIGVLFLGDSITAFWDRAPDVWKQHYGADHPADFGISGNRIEHVLWRIDHGELDGISPKVVVFLLGINNIGEPADDIARGDAVLASAIRRKLPRAKLLLLGIFPSGTDPSAADVARKREKIKKVNAALSKLDDGDHVRYLDLADKFLAPDGTLPKALVPDGTHPNAAGYAVWADGMQPLLDAMLKTAK